jgi:hypothetical protein
MHAESTGALTPGSRPGHTTHLVRHGQTAIAMDEIAGPSYYDIPLLKKPVWSWEIGCYFFLGGLSAGSYLLARVAERLGGARYRAVTRAGTAIAVTALLPCPILLIDDLGHRSRFHHMLRVFKPRSPMNLGSWVLTGYSGVLFLTALREWPGGARQRGWFDRAAVLVLDAAGLPLALFFSGYTGVLLSATSTPVWCRNPWLGPLFTASAVSNAVSTISVALQSEEQSAASEALDMIDTVAHVGGRAHGALAEGCGRRSRRPQRPGAEVVDPGSRRAVRERSRCGPPDQPRPSLTACDPGSGRRESPMVERTLDHRDHCDPGPLTSGKWSG